MIHNRLVHIRSLLLAEQRAAETAKAFVLAQALCAAIFEVSRAILAVRGETSRMDHPTDAKASTR